MFNALFNSVRHEDTFESDRQLDLRRAELRRRR
jgi:hypothetical protein